MKVLFVCTGNICRSPMAEMILNNINTNFEASSAGLIPYSGNEISEFSEKVLRSKGVKIDLNFKSRCLNVKILRECDIVLTMTYEHKKTIVENYPRYRDKVWVLGEYVGALERIEIPDPYGKDYSSYLSVYNQLEYLINKLIEKNILKPF